MGVRVYYRAIRRLYFVCVFLVWSVNSGKRPGRYALRRAGQGRRAGRSGSNNEAWSEQPPPRSFRFILILLHLVDG